MKVWHQVVEFEDEKASYNLFLDDEDGDTTHKFIGAFTVYPNYAIAGFKAHHEAEYYNRFVNLDWDISRDNSQWIKLNKEVN